MPITSYGTNEDVSEDQIKDFSRHLEAFEQRIAALKKGELIAEDFVREMHRHQANLGYSIGMKRYF